MLLNHPIKYHQNMEHQDILFMQVTKSNSSSLTFTEDVGWSCLWINHNNKENNGEEEAEQKSEKKQWSEQIIEYCDISSKQFLKALYCKMQTFKLLVVLSTADSCCSALCVLNNKLLSPLLVLLGPCLNMKKCTLHDLAQPTTLERSATKILQLNMKCGNQNMVKHSTHTNKWATRIMPHWVQGNNHSHTYIHS